MWKKAEFQKLILITIVLCSCYSAYAQFDSGSDGSYGPLNLTTSTTLPLPPDGIFHCTTIDLADNRTLDFVKNAANTPVYLLATGDVTIRGAININGADASGAESGAGGPGGFDGGQGGLNMSDGFGPGGGKAGWASSTTNIHGVKPPDLDYRGSGGYATRSTHPDQTNSAGEAYGSPLLLPIVGGSGGGGGLSSMDETGIGGGGGGGALVIASNTRITFSGNGPFIDARGGQGFINFGNGSGGAVRLVAPEISGEVRIQALPVSNSSIRGGLGRIRVDSYNRDGLVVIAGDPTYGANMAVFPPEVPEIRIEQVGTNVIPHG
ncbi:MAG: hypothetical protein AAF492_03760, partial [Verrucomicrobiota bacterium]